MANSALGYQLAQQGVDLTTSNPTSNSPTPQSVSASRTTLPKILTYPLKQITSSTDYLQIKVVEYKPPGFDKKSSSNYSLKAGTEGLAKNIEQSKTWIHLPIPSGIADSNSVDWGSDTLNPAEAYGLGAFNRALGSSGMGEALAGILQDARLTASAVAKEGAQDIVQSFFAGQLVNSLGGNVKTESIISRSTGQVLNPNMELLFNGVNLRNFTFTFDLAPREEKESIIVKDIIRTFKQAMAPRSGGSQGIGAGLFISAPSVFKLTFKTGSRDHPFLYKMKPCALTNMGVNYTASGPYTTYPDATPVHMQMTLQFTELNPIYSEDYKDVGGVGY